MQETAERAMDKIRDEMAQNPNRPELQAIGEMLTERLAADPQAAEKILEKGKTLDGAFTEMREWARKHQRGGACCVSPAQALEIVLGYYGLDAGGPIPQAHPQKAQALAPDPLGDGLDLDALLGS